MLPSLRVNREKMRTVQMELILEPNTYLFDRTKYIAIRLTAVREEGLGGWMRRVRGLGKENNTHTDNAMVTARGKGVGGRRWLRGDRW